MKGKHADNIAIRSRFEALQGLGGKGLAIRNHSHKKDHLGAYIEDKKLTLKALGYEQYCTFERMQPIFHQL